MDLGLTGRRAIVTGATRGIGRAVAETLVDEGASVAICARDATAVDRAVGELRDRARPGAAVTGRALDVADTATLGAWVDDVASELGGLDVLVSNVSVGGGPDRWQETFDVDVMATVRGTEAALPHLQRGGGAVVIVSTTSAVETFRGPTAYGALKAGLLNYAKNLAAQQAPLGVRVNSVMPGPVWFAGGAWERIEREQPEFFAEVMSGLPMGRMASPADVARAVAFLAGDATSYVSGTTVVVDGCFTRRVQY